MGEMGGMGGMGDMGDMGDTDVKIVYVPLILYDNNFPFLWYHECHLVDTAYVHIMVLKMLMKRVFFLFYFFGGVIGVRVCQLRCGRDNGCQKVWNTILKTFVGGF